MYELPVTRLYHAASDGCALFMRKAVDAMERGTIELYIKYRFAACDCMDLPCITSYVIDVFRK